MKKAFLSRLAVLMLGAALLTACADSKPQSSEAAGTETSVSQSTSATSAEKAETTAATTTTVAVTTETTTEAAADTTEIQEDENVEAKYVALTFDDGPNTTTTAEVLDKLEKYDIVASFFLIGNNISDASAEVVKRAYDMGCEINNHSRSHPDMTKLTIEEIEAEFTYTDDKIYEITGERSKFFRPPYIAVSADMEDSIDVPFIAGIGCSDWQDSITAERRAKMILRQVKDGDIILLHDAQGNSQTVEALDTIIPEMLSQGYRFVTVSELFEIKGIEIRPDDEKIYTNVLQESIYG